MEAQLWGRASAQDARPSREGEEVAGGPLRSRLGGAGYGAGAALLSPGASPLRVGGSLPTPGAAVLAQSGVDLAQSDADAGGGTCSAAAIRLIDRVIARWKAARDGTGACRKPQPKKEAPLVAWNGRRDRSPARPESETATDAPPPALFDQADDAAPVLAGGSSSAIEKARLAQIDRTIALLEKARASCALPVMTMDVPIHGKPSYLSRIVARPSRGDLVVVLDVSGDWLHVQGPDGHTGWTRREQLVPTPPASLCGVPGGKGAPNEEPGGAGRG